MQHENQPMLMPKFKTKVQIFNLGLSVLVQVSGPINLWGEGKGSLLQDLTPMGLGGKKLNLESNLRKPQG